MLTNLKIISAGAGSGKTYRLTQEMTALLTAGQAQPSGIIATTFTKRAAAELRERVRVKLLREGMSGEANELKNALIGTVHGLGVKLLQRFAFEAGVSPQVDIIAEEDHQQLFNLSMAAVISVEQIEEIEELCDKLGLSRDGEKFNWRREVLQLVDIIRGNNFSAAVIAKSKELSWSSLTKFLPPATTSPTLEQLHARLGIVLPATSKALSENEADGTKKTMTAANYLRRLERQVKTKGYLPWYEYLKLARFEKEVGAKSRELVASVVEIGVLHPALTAFQNDLKRYQDLLFDCAEAAIQEYDQYKKNRGRIDYTDMEVLVLQLLDHPNVQATLRRELDLLMVDEFQDTSPIQLAVFLKLSALAKQSIWVGDPKQSIYGFRGAEPRLMAAVMAATGPLDPANIQKNSWRSRADVVYACNAIFTKAFPETPPAAVVLEPVRTRAGSVNAPAESEDLASRSGIIHWHFELEGKSRYAKAWHQAVTAKAIKELLDNPPLVLVKDSKQERPMQAGDIAVLCRTNFSCVAMAGALAKQGIPAAIARMGLLGTAEATLLLACLKYLFNRSDSLSVAEILLFGSRKSLPEIIESRLDFLEAAATKKGQRVAWSADNELIHILDQLRLETTEHSTSEMLNLLLERLDLRRIIVAWGDGEQRLSNVDELRRLAVVYEENCHRQHRASSLGGYLLYLDQLLRAGKDKQGASERPASVNVLTYHRSKGLEWPAVIMMDLDQSLRAGVWGLAVVPETEAVDLEKPLANRWLKYWVNPYGKLTTGVPWLEALAESEWKKRAEETALAEEARLLYVGATRARDYLVFPTAKNGAPWLDRVFARGGGATPVLDPHTEQAPFDWEGHHVAKYTKTWTEPRNLPAAEIPFLPVPFLAGQRPGRKLYAPAEPTEAWLLEQYGGINFPLERLAYFTPPPSDPATDLRLLSQALGAFLSGDIPPLTTGLREERAQGLINNYLPGGEVSPERLVEQSQAFQAWIDGLGRPTAGAGAQVQRKVLVKGKKDGVNGMAVLDFVVQAESGAVTLVQDVHQAGKLLEQQLPIFAAKLQLGAALFKQKHPQTKIIGLYLHLPVNGILLALK